MEIKGQTSCQLVLTDVCPFCVLMVLVFCFGLVRTEVFYGIVHVAKLSFLAWTRNLMIMACRMCFFICRRRCAVIGVRSLVLARDDGVVSSGGV